MQRCCCCCRCFRLSSCCNDAVTCFWTSDIKYSQSSALIKSQKTPPTYPHPITNSQLFFFFILPFTLSIQAWSEWGRWFLPNTCQTFFKTLLNLSIGAAIRTQPVQCLIRIVLICSQALATNHGHSTNRTQFNMCCLVQLKFKWLCMSLYC